MPCWNVICFKSRQIVLPVGPLRSRVQMRKGGGHMTDYEMLMIVLSFLTLLVMVSKKNNG